MTCNAADPSLHSAFFSPYESHDRQDTDHVMFLFVFSYEQITSWKRHKISIIFLQRFSSYRRLSALGGKLTQ